MGYKRKRNIVLIFMVSMMSAGCSCSKKFEQLEYEIRYKTEEIRTLETEYRRELKNKDTEISALEDHIKLLNEQITELKSK